ncbi:HAMP domain-containing protein [Paenibacillus sp. N3.4]|uniref:HAMP domain-containing protein n=1 Tax=Paenibacillus sp. N3.4 TaxID=2603222 RepID=UPI001C9C0DC8|nr:HAMP domain-containing protein [Paenibacillus sp. N3.4]
MEETARQTTKTGLPNMILLANLNFDLKNLDDLMLRIQLNMQDKSSQGYFNESGSSSGDITISPSDKAKSLFNDIQERIKLLDGIFQGEKDVQLLNAFKDQWGQYANHFPATLSAVEAHGAEGMSLIQLSSSSLSSCSILIEMFTKKIQNQADEWVTNLDNSYKTGLSWIIVLSIIAIIVGLVISFLIARHVSQPIISMSTAAKRISEGDLSVQHVSLRRQDEIGALSSSFNLMTEHMRSMIQTVNGHAVNVPLLQSS